MPEIIYTPITVNDPKNHPRRILISCHKDDFLKFDKIQQDIKSVEKDCVIAYVDYKQGDDDRRYLQEIENFHMIIIPITRRWLETDNPSRTLEFVHALEKHKAVLPILFEDEAENMFNEKTKNLQFLRVTDADYEEKMKRTLQEVFLDDYDVKIIAKIFSHRMFIAYCREDFEKTQELIRCIHQKEFGRKVAIWYDKYLAMGKNFEDSIFEHLDDCHLFAINITPNLLHRDNYVKEIEYKRALEKKKEIVLMESVSSNPDEVKKQFSEVAGGNCMYVSDRETFLKELKKLLKEVKGQTNDFDQCAMDYLLGKAYLYGVGVEFDSEYALRKLEKSARAGHLAATEELVKMYTYGIGVERCPQKAIYWRKGTVDIVLGRYRETYFQMQKITKKMKGLKKPGPKECMEILELFDENAEDVIIEYGKYATLLRDEGEMEEALSCYEKMLFVLDEIDEIASGLRMKEKYEDRIRNDMGVLKQVLGRMTENEEDWKRTFEKYKRNSKDFMCAYNAIVCGHSYGVQLIREKKTEEARKIIWEILGVVEDFKHVREIYEMMLKCYREMGQSYLVEEKPRTADAREWFLKTLQAHKNKPFEDRENEYLQFMVSQVAVMVGESYRLDERHKEAVSMYLKAIESIQGMEESLGEKATFADFPVSLLQAYTKVFERMDQYEFENSVEIVNVMRKVLCKYEKIVYHKEHKEMANMYLESIRKSIKKKEGESHEEN